MFTTHSFRPHRLSLLISTIMFVISWAVQPSLFAGKAVNPSPPIPDPIEARVREICGHIQKKNLAQAQIALEQFWTAHSSDADFVDCARSIKDQYWTEGQYAAHFDLCERIVTAFPNDPLSIGIQVDQVTGYIKLKNMAKASEKLDQFWARYRNDNRFVDYARWIKDQYWMDGHYKEHFNLCEELVKTFPDDPLTPAIWADDVTGYVRVHNMPKAAEQLEKFWAKHHTNKDFVKHMRYVKDVYWIEGEYNAHFDLCERIVKEFPNDPLTPRIWADDITGYIRLDEMEKAAEELDRFWTHCHSKKDFIDQIRYIKDVCWIEEEYGTHFDLCERIISAFPNDPMTMGIRADEITGYMKLGNTAKAEEKLQPFLAECNSDKQFVASLNTIAAQYNQAGNHQKAIELYQYALEHSASDDTALVLAKTGMLISRIGMNDGLDKVPFQIEKLVSDHADNPYLAQSLFMIGEEYYLRGQKHLQKNQHSESRKEMERALEIWGPVRNQSADALHQTHAVYYSAVACQKIGQYEQAIDYYEQVVSQWPAYGNAWHAQYMIAQCYETLAKENRASPEAVQAAYRQLIEKYPNTSAAQRAARKLGAL